jgi:hypothetical protein
MHPAFRQAAKNRAALARIKKRPPHPIVAPVGRHRVLIHRSTRRSGWWQATFFDEEGQPYGHVESSTWRRLLGQVAMDADWTRAERVQATRNPADDVCEAIKGVTRSTVHDAPLPAVLKDFPQKDRPRPKPTGLWYSFGDEWARWMSIEMPHWLDSVGFLYRLEVDTEKIIVLGDEDDALEFSEDYAIEITGDEWDPMYYVNWAEVAEDFAGIEVGFELPRGNANPEELFWLEGWDVASGCIWDTSAITSWGLVAEMEPGQLAQCYA